MTRNDGGDILTKKKGLLTVATRKRFTAKEIHSLKKNPNTLSVTENRISFTMEAKKRILELSATGKSIRMVLKELGYDPEVLGYGRMKSIMKNARREADSGIGLHNGYARQAKRKPLTTEEIADLGTDIESYAKLKNEVVYLRAEVEFLKKISQQVISGKRGK